MLAIDERLRKLQEREAARQADLRTGRIRIVPPAPKDPDKRLPQKERGA